ncbi:MAG TPA: DNA-3-methyladenine glycosylase I [Bacillota bacterium]|nr:DNA-3-methyladenine glycosylase I [Bacillota bacterium]
MKNNISRCSWVTDDPLYITYHDEEWGPLYTDGFPHSDTYLFEMLTLEGAQAGLSWMTILKRRDAYKQAFAGYDVEKIATFTEEDEQMILTSTNIIRNQLKVQSVIQNAKAFIRVQEKFGSFQNYIWDFFNQQQRINHFNNHEDVPAWTEESKAWSKDLKNRGFSFVGPTICYAFMQAVGIVFDHTIQCEQYKQMKKMYTKEP